MAVIDSKYQSLLNKILNKGFRYEDPNRKGVHRIQIPHYQFEHSFEDGFPAVTTKKLYWKGIVGELLWFLRGSTNIKYLVDNNINIWNKDAFNYYLKRNPEGTKDSFKEGISKNNHIAGDLGRVYGSQWRKWNISDSEFDLYDGRVDQISNLIKGLKENPMGTRHIVTAWNPAELDDMALPPCHWSFEILVEPRSKEDIKKELSNLGATWSTSMSDKQFKAFAHKRWKVREYQFTLKWHQRSVDTFLGLPFNIASYALLAYIIGRFTNMVPKGIIGDLSNVHIYEPHLDAVATQLGRKTTMWNTRCELIISNPANTLLSKFKDIDDIVKGLKINDFNLTKHTEQPAIKAEMLPYNK